MDRTRIVIIAQEEGDPIPATEGADPQSELPVSFGVRIGTLAIFNFMTLVRYVNTSSTGININAVSEQVMNSPELTGYNLKDSLLDQALQAGGSSRQIIRVGDFLAFFQKLTDSKQFDASLIGIEAQAAQQFAPEPTNGTPGGRPPYDAMWTMIGQKFATVVQEQMQQRRQQQAPPVQSLPRNASMKLAQMDPMSDPSMGAPPPPPMPSADPATQPVPQDQGILGQKYESVNDMREDLLKSGPSEETYSNIFSLVGPENEDSARESLSGFFQGSAEAAGVLYGMLVAAGKATPIDAETVGELMEQHPELYKEDAAKQASSEDIIAKYAGLFIPKCSSLTKLADSGAFPHYPSAGAATRMCPKIRDTVPLEICRYHCLDGLVVDDAQVLCGEAIWRQSVMDKFSTEYRDKDGNWVGGYLNKRFKIERDDGGHPALLKPGTRSNPIHEDAWSMEKRLQEMRRDEGKARGYSDTVGDPKGLYNFDPYQKGPENPQLSEKKTDPMSRTAFNLKQTRLAAGLGDNGMENMQSVNMGAVQPQCLKCGKKGKPGQQVCDNPNFNQTGMPCRGTNFKDVTNTQISQETGNISAPTMASVSVTENLGVFCAEKNGIKAFAMSSKEALVKLAAGLADLQVDPLGQQNEELAQLRQNPQQNQQKPTQPQAPQQPVQPQAPGQDPTPSTPGIPPPENPVPDEVQGGQSEFGTPEAESAQPVPAVPAPPVQQPTPQEAPGAPKPIGNEGWSFGGEDEGHHVSGDHLDSHMESEPLGHDFV